MSGPQRHVVQPAVVHERVISSRVIHQTSFADAPKDIVDTAVGAGTFKTLAAALGAAELVDTLKGDGPFTVFAPTDEAFGKLPAGTVETLLKPENKEKLKEILLLHVVPGSVYAADVVKLTEAKTAGGKVVKVSRRDPRDRRGHPAVTTRPLPCFRPHPAGPRPAGCASSMGRLRG
ncbi:MAG: fasciclin domain-containing protein [Planctomycetia bacterium]|nr:fasciclin domain-containing protein [Planctomycetia bacterium]